MKVSKNLIGLIWKGESEAASTGALYGIQRSHFEQKARRRFLRRREERHSSFGSTGPSFAAFAGRAERHGFEYGRGIFTSVADLKRKKHALHPPLPKDRQTVSMEILRHSLARLWRGQAIHSGRWIPIQR
jgi:hypothetical protein